METSPNDLHGLLLCIDWSKADVDSAFQALKAPEAFSGFSHPYVVLDQKEALAWTPPADSSSMDSIDSETEARLQELEEPPYDHNNAPKIGFSFQADFDRLHELAAADTPELERAKGGELVWSPEPLGEREVDRYLAETQCNEGDDIDEFFQPWRNREFDANGVPTVVDDTPVDLNKPCLITQEKALLLLARAGYDTERAKEELKAGNSFWSAKKRDIEAWEDPELFKFELNMRLSKPFRELPSRLPGKSLKEVLHFYYTWKKTPRFANWKKRRAAGMAIRELAPVVYDAPSGAPLKEDEFAQLRQFMGLRSRPRVDYSQSSTGHHIWRSTTSGFKRKMRGDDSSSDTEDDKLKPPLQAYEIRVDADVSLEQLRIAKRRRVRDDGTYVIDATLPMQSDEELLADLSQQELLARSRSLSSYEPDDDDAMVLDQPAPPQ